MLATESIDRHSVAIIGMAGRFPGARNIDEFWRNLCDGVESISFFTEEELRSAGEASSVIKDPHYVGARGILEGVELFDASFFGFYPREAQLMDPQHRLFLECAWEALEDAGCVTESYEGVVGVFGGAGINSYLLSILSRNQEGLSAAEGYQLAIGNYSDFLTSRVSYKLNLRGPSLNIQSACSTSLVSVHVACRSLLGRQCDMALAGGVAIGLPQKSGYLFQEGMILSPDGHCRTFDANAQGTVPGNGVGIVVLKRLADAVAEGDQIYAVIKGSAVNNDGSLRVGFTAPGVAGQAEVIATAHEIAGIDPETVTFIEAHGTGTSLGDPIEIAALTQVFREKTDTKGFCAIGSVKTNVGHLDAAAGVAGLIKAALALDRGLIPPSLNFERPNPKIDFSDSPFYVNTKLSQWKAGDGPRRAGVSSFGIGGSNAHVVLEEAPASEGSTRTRPWQLLALSAKTDSALETATERLAAHLKAHSDLKLSELSLADIAYTLQTGRKAFTHRRIIVSQTLESAWNALETRDPKRVFSASVACETDNRPVVFMFSGQGAQYVNMGSDLYQAEPIFREAIDYCAELLKPHLDWDLRDLLYPTSERAEEAASRLSQTRITQPALFALEYALAKLWMEWGIRPQAMIGHSVGEYTAACLAGVCSLKDAVRLVAARGRLMQGAPEGAMLSVRLEEPAARDLLGSKLSLAAVNGPASCVVSGRHDAIVELEQRLREEGVDHRRLHTSHAFHSEMMDSILNSFEREVEKVTLKSPQIPYVSNLTGTWITDAEATDPGYYAKHLRHTVRFADGIGELLKEPDRVLLEVGPGQTLSALARENSGAARGRVVLNSTRHPQDQQSDVPFILNTLGRLWLAGVKLDWPRFYAKERRLRVSLPAYPFERQRYWLDLKEPAITGDIHQSNGSQANSKAGSREIADWFYTPSWKRADKPRALAANAAPDVPADEKVNWLLLSDDHGLGSRVAERLGESGQYVITVKMGKRFERIGERAYLLDPQSRADYEALLTALIEQKKFPQKIAHFWNVTPTDQVRTGPEFFEEAQVAGFYSLLFLTQALGRRNVMDPLQLWVVSTNLQEVTGEELLCPEKATLLGACQVIPQECPNIDCRSLDLNISESWPDSRKLNGLPRLRDEGLRDRLVTEFTANISDDRTIAYRGNHRWALSYERTPADSFGQSSARQSLTRLRQGGVYLITGGLGNIGLTIAEYLARTAQAKLILVGRSEFPPRDEWDRWLATHDERDQASRKIRKLMEIEEAGGEVLILSADVANEPQMQRVINRADERFGRIHGVIHAAGEVGEKAIRTVQEMDPEQCASQFQAKIHGLNVLAGALRGKELDFCILQSSLSSVLGGLGFAAYSAANHYLDAFARKQSQTNGAHWVSVNWDGWRFDEEKRFGSEAVELAISPQDGVEVLKSLLSVDGFNQVIISTGDLHARIGKWIKGNPKPEQRAEARSNSSPALASRPQLQTTYVAPGSELERRIVEVWQNLLGVEPVGIHDNFFELGGDSLLGTQMIAQLRSIFQTEFPMRGLFEDPTVVGAAKIIETAMSDGQSQVDKLTEALKKVEGLSDEDAGALLAGFNLVGDKASGSLATNSLLPDFVSGLKDKTGSAESPTDNSQG
jgi:acyl transferase domain-containing protein